MTTFSFTLVLRSPRAVTTAFEDAVFEAGCDDAALGFRNGTVVLDFDREADSFLDAVLTAIDALQRVPGTSVAQLEPEEIVSASEIARRTSRTRESVRLLIEGARGPGGFPAPLAGGRVKGGRVWRWSEVLEWFEAQGLAAGAQPEGQVIAAVNGALALARNADEASQTRILKALSRAS